MIVAEKQLSHNLKVLVADDEKDIRRLLAFILQKAGYQVIEATDGIEALEMAEQNNPDIILLDVMMPKMHGFEVCRNLRSRPATANTPILVLSAQSQSTDIIEALQSGATYYLLKPFTPRELLEKVNKVVAGINLV